MSSTAEPERVPWREVYVVVLLLLVRLYDDCIEHFATLIDNMHFVDFVKFTSRWQVCHRIGFNMVWMQTMTP